MEKQKVYLIDASPIFYKAFFAIPPLSSKNGVPTNAAYGFTNALIKIIKKHNPELIAVCFDKKSKFRTELYENYKIDRKKMSSNLSVQIPIVKKVTEALGILCVEKDGYEADDLIGMLTSLSLKNEKEVIIISPDKDFCQLVQKDVKVLEVSKEILYDEQKVEEKFGIKPNQITDYLGLAGDSVDGIPGILGIGKETAIKLIKEFGNLENIILNVEKLKPGIKKKIESGRTFGELSKKLATIITDEKELSIKDIEDLRKGFADRNQLANLFDALNFLSLKNKISDLE